MSADPNNPFDGIENSEGADGTRPKYRPPIERGPGRGRKWLVAGVVAVLLLILSFPLLGQFGIKLWPGADDEYEAVALTNRHGGTAGVYFTGRVKANEARAIGQLMIDADAFGGSDGADVLIDREGDAVVVSVFYGAVPPTEALNEFYPPVRKRLSDELFGGGPVVIEVCTRDVGVVMRKVKRNVRVRFT